MQEFNFSEWPCYEPDEVSAVTCVLESGKVNYWTGEEERCKVQGERLKGKDQKTEDGRQKAEVLLSGLVNFLAFTIKKNFLTG